MNTTTYNDGSVQSTFHPSRKAALLAAAASLASLDVRAVETTKLADMPDDYPCPCRSGMKFGRCCKQKAAR